MTEQQNCSSCSGTGRCSRCGGAGMEKFQSPGPKIDDLKSDPGGKGFSKSCAKCNGTGTCQKCYGSRKE